MIGRVKMYKQNLHTHTYFCDGRNSPEEIVLAAIEKNFDSLGFSGHSHISFSSDVVGMTLPDTQKYRQEVKRLQEKYAGAIDLYCGLEVEMYSQVDTSDYDYLIGSVHCLQVDGQYMEFDRDAGTVEEIICRYFDGNGMKYARAYYEALSTLPEYGKFDFIGHFDIVAKHSEKYDFFDTESPRYLQYAFDAVDALKGKIGMFEFNTGAIARGYRTTPYPSIPILKRLLESGFLPIVTSDCHSKDMLDCYFMECLDMLEYCGAKERCILSKDGFRTVALR